MGNKLDVLRDMSFGSEVAEYDTDLRSYFVRTESFVDIVNDRHDLVLGAKGTGKSAIFQMLIDENYAIPELGGTAVIPGFDADDGSVLKRLLQQHADIPEAAFRLIWKSYVTSLAGVFLSTSDLADRTLLTALRDADLLPSEKGSVGAWKKALGGVRAALDGVAMKGELEVTPGILPGLKAKLAIDKAAGSAGSHSGALLGLDALIQNALEAVVRVIKSAEINLWVCFDRLDEFFADDPDVERLALRALLRTHSDLRSLAPYLRLKIFLRNDILRRVTKDSGFVNLTHLRALNLVWSRDKAAIMVADRAWRSAAFRASYADGNNAALERRPAARDILDRVLPARMAYYTPEVKPGFVWAVDQMMDGARLINPRNILTLMTECRQRQIEILAAVIPQGTPDGNSLISGDTLKRAVIAVGKKRIEDTLYAEHNSLRTLIERFRFGPRAYSLDRLVKRLEISPDDAYPTILDLDESGFLQRTGPKQWVVAALYAGTLNIAFGGPVHSERGR